jgi:hypothetical protein
MNIVLRFAAVALLCAGAIRAGIPMTIEYDVKPERPDFPVLDPVKLIVTVRNTGPGELELANPAARSSQPTYTLRGPSFPDGKTFTKVDLDGPSAERRPPPDSDRIRIGPGSTWEGAVTLTRMLRLESPGNYELTSVLLVDGMRAQSTPSVFRITQVAPDVADVGTGLRDEGGEGEVAFLQRRPDGALVYAEQFNETRPDIGEARFFPLQLRRRAGGEAAEILVPSTNAPFNAKARRWVLWRERTKVIALDTYGALLSVDLPSPPAALVRPALRPANEEPEVLALDESRRSVRLVRFTEQSGAVAWTAQLPAEARSIVAALGSTKKGSIRHIAFAAEMENGIAIFHSQYTRDGGLGGFKQVRYEQQRAPEKPLPPPRVLAAVPPALFVDHKERAWAGFVAVDANQVMWIEARFAEGLFRDDDGVTATPLAPLDSPPVAGSLLYVDGKDGSLSRREAVLQLPDRRLVRLKGGVLQRLSVQGTPTTPMLLVPGRSATYIVYADPMRGLYLEPL